MQIRQENLEDAAEIHRLNELAFDNPAEAKLVDKLRANHDDLLSLVAVNAHSIIGHILFSKVIIKYEAQELAGMAIGPMAVLPDLQRQGVGTELVQKGIEEIKETGCPFVIVLGHVDFYPRFGFERASQYGIKCQWDGVPDAAFMILWVDAAQRGQLSGTARYAPEFDEVA